MLTESILNSTKKMLGIEKEIKNFDDELIMNINSVFATLCDLGVGPNEPYMIHNDKNTWNEFTTGSRYQDIKTYIYLRVRLLFDPPTNSFAVKSFEDQIKELEWRLNVRAETEPDGYWPKERLSLLTIERDICDFGPDHGHHHCHDHRPKPPLMPGKPKPPHKPEKPKPPHCHKPRPKPDDPDDDNNQTPENPDEPGEDDGPVTSTDLFIKPEDGKLPEVGEPDKIYLIPNGGGDDNLYDEYFWDVDHQKFELISPDQPKINSLTKSELIEKWNNAFKGD